MEAWRLKMEPCRVDRPGAADSHHFNEEQEPDPDPHLSEKLDLGHMKVMLIHNPK
jgi:hypothetical protein